MGITITNNYGQVVETNYGTLNNEVVTEHDRGKQPSTEETDVEEATKAAMEYVGRLKEMVKPEWVDRYIPLWTRIFGLPQVRGVIAIVGKQQGTTFNRNLVANITHLMLQTENIFQPAAKPIRMAERLENNKDHSVKAALGVAPEDKDLKQAVNGVLEESFESQR